MSQNDKKYGQNVRFVCFLIKQYYQRLKCIILFVFFPQVVQKQTKG